MGGLSEKFRIFSKMGGTLEGRQEGGRGGRGGRGKRQESKDGSSSLGSKFIGKGAQYSWKSVTFAVYKQNKESL